MSKKRQKSGSDKSFTLKKIEPKTPSQIEMVEEYGKDFNLVLHGVAGTGKTFLSLWLGLKDVLAGNYEKVIIIRSEVSSRPTGFLPGDPIEKASVYEEPYIELCSELFGRGDIYGILKSKLMLEFRTTSYLRGKTLRDAVVIVDEIQNMNFEELETVITRMGPNCRVIFCGDLDQNDLHRNKYDQSGLPQFLDIIENCESFSFVEFFEEDIVRSGIVKEWIMAKIAYLDQQDVPR